MIKLIKMLQWCLLLDTFSLFSMWSGMEKCGKPFLFYSLFFSWKECNEGCRGCKGRRSPLLHHAPYVQFSDPLKIRRPPVKTNVLTVKKEIVWAGKWVHFSREKLPLHQKCICYVLLCNSWIDLQMASNRLSSGTSVKQKAFVDGLFLLATAFFHRLFIRHKKGVACPDCHS